ncbi:MAG TPA: SchA/CurD-like domain-containing protein [Trebonia sp.]|nr:SchA/CurD-like domain-containing protein [Trebonia sp.]
MAPLPDSPLQPSASATSRLRVLFLMDVLDDHQERFLEAYEQIRHQVADVPGHISDQLCQSLGNSSQWLITSEWENSEPFLAWVDSPAHRELVAPMSACLGSRSSLRYLITRETPDPLAGPREPAGRAASDGHPAAAASAPRTDPLPAPPLASGGIVRHGLTFTVRPGSEPAVAEILASYSAPQARVDATTRLCRTSLFMRGNRVVRAVEVTGDLGNAMRHVAAQPEVRAVEEAINPYLEEPRDFSDSTSVRAFFARAALPAVRHVQAPSWPAGEVTRRGFLYPARAGCAASAMRLLADLDQAAAWDPGHPLAGSTLFLRDDLLVRVVDLAGSGRGESADPALGADAVELGLLLDPGQDRDLTASDGVRDFLASCAMDLITDRGTRG